MPLARAVVATVLAVLSAAALASCGRSPTTPSANGPSPPVTVRVELIAPRTLAPGATAQLRLIARRSDGSTEDVTATARFYGGPQDVLAVSPDGSVTALRVGDSGVTGQTDRFSSSSEIIVVPEGTFRVVGQVVEEGTQGLPVGGVRIEVDNGQSEFTDHAGGYRLYGVPSAARMRVSKNGYVSKELTLAISDHHTENVALALDGPRTDVAGVYQLTIDAAPECRDQIPERLLTRRYTAAISQIGTSIRVVVTGGRFVTSTYGNMGNSTMIPGQVDQTGVVLQLSSPSHCEGTEPDSRVVEIVDDTTVLAIGGLVRLSAAGPNLTGNLNGHLHVYADARCGSPSHAFCPSSSHRVTLTR